MQYCQVAEQELDELWQVIAPDLFADRCNRGNLSCFGSDFGSLRSRYVRDRISIRLILQM